MNYETYELLSRVDSLGARVSVSVRSRVDSLGARMCVSWNMVCLVKLRASHHLQ